jgi:hypothetical protein
MRPIQEAHGRPVGALQRYLQEFRDKALDVHITIDVS